MQQSHSPKKRPQPWLLFIVLLLAAAVVACIVTIVIALQNPDSPAAGNYRKNGLAVEALPAAGETQAQP